MVQPLINTSDFIGTFIVDLTTNVTGSLFLTLLVIMLVVFLVLAVFRMPMELSAIVMMPLFINATALTQDLLILGGLAAIYVGILYAKIIIST